MGLTYEVDTSAGIVFVYWSGPVTIRDISDHWALMLNDNDALLCGKCFVDVRKSDPRFTGEELRQLVKTVLEPALQGGGWKSAILVEKPVQYGVARQYQVFTETFSEDAIFTDEVAAHEWIRG
jgi:hypothetical protein